MSETGKNKPMRKPWSAQPMPPQHKVLLIDGLYEQAEFQKIQKGFLPKSADNKWVILFKKNILHFFRSQTGTCIYQIHFEPKESQVNATKVVVNRSIDQYKSTDDAYDVSMVSYLIDTMLLGRFAPLPKPKGLRDSDFNRYKKDIVGDENEGSIDLKLD